MLFKLGKSTITSKYIKQITSFSSFELGSQQHEKRTKSFCYFFLLSKFSPQTQDTHTHTIFWLFFHMQTLLWVPRVDAFSTLGTSVQCVTSKKRTFSTFGRS